MKIKRLSASFGKLKNEELQFGGKLNILTAPNEAGKSTWCAFIRAMLYGINSSERDKTGYLSDKTRYRPWDGGPMEGVMEVEDHGKDITLQRTSHGAAPMKKFIAVYTGTNERVDYLSGENAGEVLTGVSEPVFERTAFIRQSKIPVNQTAELERRIAALVSTGEEQSSFTESVGKLRAWQRKLQHNKSSGSMPKLRAEIAAAKEKVAELEEMHEDIGDIHQEIERLEKNKQQLYKDLEAHDKLEALASQKKVLDAMEKEKMAKKAVAQLSEKLTVGGEKLTREDIVSLKAKLASVQSLKAAFSVAEEKKQQAEEALEEVQRQKENGPFSNLSCREAEEKAAQALKYSAAIEEASAKNRTVQRVVSIIVALVGALLTALFSGLWKFMLLPLWGSSFLCIGGIAGFVLSFNNTDKYLKEELSKILLEFGFDTAEELAKAVEEYRTACEKYEEQKERYTAEMQGFLTAGNALKSGEETALNEMRKFFPAVSSVEQAAKAAEEAEKLFHMLSQAEAIALSAENVSQALQADYEGNLEETTEFVPKPLRSREDTKAAVERAENKLQELSKEYNILCGQAQAVGDPVVLMGEIKELEEKLSVQEEQYDALSLAVEILTGAENEMQLRFSPVISRRAGEIMKRLTGGKYEKVSFDKNFDALAKESGETVGRSALSLSEGTENQLYLALRIAMCELILTGDDPCPLILDDALFSFDDERMKKTLDYLKEISETRQILLFSCQTREAEYFKGADDVRFITLA